MSKILYTDDPQTKERIKADGLKQARMVAVILGTLASVVFCLATLMQF